MNINEMKEWYAAEVKERMEELGLRPYHMTHKCQLNHEGISGYLKGTVWPNPWSLVPMAETLECCVNDLLGYELPEDTSTFETYRASKMFNNKEEYAHCFAERLVWYLNKRGILLEDLSNRTGFTVKTLKSWTSDFNPKLITTANLLKVCDALNCTPSDILGY